MSRSYPAIALRAADIICRAALFFLFICLIQNPCFLQAKGSTSFITIFHTNDVHGYAVESRDEEGQLTNIGYPKIKSYVDSYNTKHKMLLDAGDVLHGMPFATAGQGEFVARLLSDMHYDAVAVGNHDFDYGLARMMNLRDQYSINFIAANIIEKEDGAFLLPPYIIKDFDGFKVGVFGLSTPETPVTTAPYHVESVSFGTPEEIVDMARQTVRTLKAEGVHMVVALTHLGTDPQGLLPAQEVARQVPGIDLVVDGHSHSEVAGLRVGDSLIVSTGSYLNNLGQVVVRRNDDNTFTLAPSLIPAADFEDVKPDSKLEAVAIELSKELEQEMRRVVVVSPFDLNGERDSVRSSVTNFGRLLCAALKDEIKVDAAILNGGDIRASIAAGEVTKGDLLKALPYGNHIMSITLKGEDILNALTIGLSQINHGGFPQFYGMRVAATEIKQYESDGTIIRYFQPESVEINGRELDLNGEYTLAISDFMYAGGDGYTVFSNYSAQAYSTVDEAFVRYLAETSPNVLSEVNNDEVLSITASPAEKK